MKRAFHGYAGSIGALASACSIAFALVLLPSELRAYEPPVPHLNAFLAGLDQRMPQPVTS